MYKISRCFDEFIWLKTHVSRTSAKILIFLLAQVLKSVCEQFTIKVSGTLAIFYVNEGIFFYLFTCLKRLIFISKLIEDCLHLPHIFFNMGQK